MSAGRSHMAHNPCMTDPKTMPPRQHFAPAFTVGSAQNGILVPLIQEKDAYMIKAKLLTDYMGEAGKKCVLILNRGGCPRHLCDGFELAGAALDSLVGYSQFCRTLCNPVFQALIQLLETFVGDEQIFLAGGGALNCIPHAFGTKVDKHRDGTKYQREIACKWYGTL